MPPRLFLAVLFSITPLVSAPFQDPSQPAPARPEIRGTVLEPGTLQPINGAEVWLFAAPKLGSLITGATFTRENALETATTDSTGSFHFTPNDLGSYRIQVKKEGFGPSGSPMKGTTNTTTLTLTSGHPTQEAHLQLARPAQVTGQVLDEETRKPVPNLPVGIRMAFDMNGRHRFLPTSGATTDAEGRFVAANVTPGDYVAVIRPKVSGKDRVMKQFSKDDLEAMDSDFEETYWPGGHGQDSAFPIPAGSGATASLGQLVLRKKPLYRVHVSFAEGTCPSADPVNIGQFIMQGTFTGEEDLGTVPCGQDFVIRGFAPGSYLLQLWGGRGADRRNGIMSFDIKDKNLEVSVSMVRGVDVEGKIVAADGVKLPALTGIMVGMRPIGGIPFADGFVKVDGNGGFHIVNAQVTRHQLTLSGISAALYVKEIRYNGSRLSDINFVPLNPHAMTQSLEIVLDDKPATIAGTVSDSDRPVAQASVLLVAWPPSSEDAFLSLKRATADDDGKFQFAGLTPGEYRALAIPPVWKDEIDKPNVLERLLPGAQKVEAGPGGFQNVTLPSSNPMR